jgi:hypothetical protein
MKKHAAAVAAGLGLVAAVAAGGVAFASGNNDDDATVTGVVADRAMTAALKYAPGATPHTVERDSENGATWEVEVTRTNGQVVDVRLTGSYKLVAIEGDFADNRPSIG